MSLTSLRNEAGMNESRLNVGRNGHVSFEMLIMVNTLANFIRSMLPPFSGESGSFKIFGSLEYDQLLLALFSSVDLADL